MLIIIQIINFIWQYIKKYKYKEYKYPGKLFINSSYYSLSRYTRKFLFFIGNKEHLNLLNILNLYLLYLNI